MGLRIDQEDGFFYEQDSVCDLLDVKKNIYIR